MEISKVEAAFLLDCISMALEEGYYNTDEQDKLGQALIGNSGTDDRWGAHSALEGKLIAILQGDQ